MNKDISKVKIFVTGGGTGGHIYPAVSVIGELLSEGASIENIFYIGNKKNPEYKIANDNGYKFLSTSVSGMPRKLSLKFVQWTFCLLSSIIKCVFYALKYKPDVVFATGGYVCAPVLFAAKILNIPYVLHDSDCFPGIVTRTFASGAKGINLAFSNAKKHIKNNNIRNYNNPVRSSFFNKTKEAAREELKIDDKFLILIMGGSQGAKSINKAAISLIDNLKENDKIKIILQTGRKNYDTLTQELEIPSNTRVEPYFDDMSVPILAADLIVSRAGSISISEILSAKAPSILVPYPYAAADHQRINAKAILEQNAALYIEDSELKDNLEKTVLELLENKEKYDSLKENAARLGKDFHLGTKRITELVLSAIK